MVEIFIFCYIALSKSSDFFSLNAEQLWVLDSVPGEVEIDDKGGEVEKVLSTLKFLPNPIPSRRYFPSSNCYVCGFLWEVLILYLRR
jgi:hypothetical protein